MTPDFDLRSSYKNLNKKEILSRHGKVFSVFPPYNMNSVLLKLPGQAPFTTLKKRSRTGKFSVQERGQTV